MSESTPVSAPVSAAAKPEPNPDRLKNLVVVLTLLTTVFAAILACLQADANIRASIANRESQYLAVEATGALYRTGLKFSYDMNTVAEVLKNTQTALVMQFTALGQQNNGDQAGADQSTVDAIEAQARADQARLFSVFYTDSRYAPATENDMPDFNLYLTDSSDPINEIVARQNASSDEYHKWNAKSDSYVAILTMMAVIFFLLSLAQAGHLRLRIPFAFIALVMMVIAGLWSFMVIIS